ncbi:RagB/SusD family nutrient uptake outer membrane protein [Saccharicrinis sp. FJH54]|uniref:RagB/SusD family nutrient uptake outer membrane protein n=1 Tax=Saccharicrinis sp. FJH54 TaxID=3344665 RepID=UPI0035D3F8C6
MKISTNIIALFLLVLLASCEKVLDKRDLNVIDDNIWESADQSTLYVNNLYEDNMPGMSLGTNSPLSDETFSSSDSYTDLLYGGIGINDINAVQIIHRNKYQLIRRINICIDGLKSSSLSEDVKNPILAQALFFRAWRYWEMVRANGGVPMVLSTQDPFFDDLNVPRSKTSVSIDLIMADLDSAISWLPIDWERTEDKGRITSGAAAAFKGRILLTWASPLFNRNNDQSRWQGAYDANKEAINILSQMSTPRNLYPDFSKVFTTNVLENVEAVIYKRFDVNAGTDYTSDWEGKVRPPSGGGDGSYAPTWNLVKAFPMENGKRIEEAGSGYDSTVFWKNRDPRFYATIGYNGCEWVMNGRDDQIQWTYYLNMQENKRSPATGFYCKKATDPLIAEENTGQTSTTWHELRYAEVLLNFAESANEIGKIDEALTEIRRIRNRAGIESGDGDYGIPNSVSKEELRQLIMKERQVEFAFENKRYWDLRRRLMFREDLGSFTPKLNGTQRLGFDIRAKSPWNRRISDRNSPYFGWNRIDTATMGGYVDLNDPSNYNSYFTTDIRIMESIVGGEVKSINYLPLYDFFAVSSSMLSKSPAVEQTLGWVNGTFDPLAE